MSRWVQVAPADALPDGELLGVMADGMPVVIANVDGELYALKDQCSHEEYPLSDGELEGPDVVCIYHGARFDVRTGARKTLPAIRPVRAFPVEVREGEIYVDIG
jgi:nitrite reductase/ring-hydroxylating ferredoxin subunit